MQNYFTTERLRMDEISTADAHFMLELLNTPGWIRFIGERNVKTVANATDFIQKMIDSPDARCWTVKLAENQLPLGIITFITREFLPHPDIGFAFLPQHEKKGYAFESVSEAMRHLFVQYPTILANTLKENTNSIALLKKLGFSFQEEIYVENETLSLYSVNYTQ